MIRIVLLSERKYWMRMKYSLRGDIGIITRAVITITAVNAFVYNVMFQPQRAICDIVIVKKISQILWKWSTQMNGVHGQRSPV